MLGSHGCKFPNCNSLMILNKAGFAVEITDSLFVLGQYF